MLKPLNGKVLIRENKPAEKTKGGLYIPDSAEEGKVRTGTIVAVSSGLKLKDGSILAHDVKIGDTVIFGAYSGIEVETDEKLLMVSEEDIFAIQE